MPTTSPTPHTVEALLRVVEERDSEVVLLKLMDDKLTLQLLRARRAQYGRSSEQPDDPQIALIEGAPLYEHPAPKAAPKAQAANSAGMDRQLPAHLPREDHVHRAAATDAAVDASGNACGCTACGGRLRQIGADVSEQLEYGPARFKVIRHVRPKLACVACQSIFQAAAPSRPKLPLEEATTSSWVRTPGVSARRRSTVWWRRPSSLPARGAHVHCRPSHKPHRRTAALEHRAAR